MGWGALQQRTQLVVLVCEVRGVAGVRPKQKENGVSFLARFLPLSLLDFPFLFFFASRCLVQPDS
jgi:hypothetical protein